MNLNFKLIYVIIVIISIFVLYYYKVKRQQSENFAPIEVPILPQYKNITPTQLFALFDNNLDKMTRAMIESKIPDKVLKTPLAYPKIASILAKNKLI
jgi:hypothetical protein